MKKLLPPKGRAGFAVGIGVMRSIAGQRVAHFRVNRNPIAVDRVIVTIIVVLFKILSEFASKFRL